MSILYTNRLILRPFKETDANAMYKNWTFDSRVAKYCRWHPHSIIEMTQQILNRYLDEAKNGFNYRWAITLRGTDEPIGAIDVVELSKDNKSATIGYALSYNYWNQGFTTEALKAVIKHLFDNGFCVVKAEHHIDNTASGRVMEKCGMKYTGDSTAQRKFGSDEYCIVKQYQIENNRDSDI
ncbi:MAG: GNAT family N-acetyltransferase [Clostridia bacterium]|nr:GNAT family N-acetyltransferase [Clostridia bacterium]